jgi:hemolysin III
MAAETARARISVAVYAISLAVVFGTSALYHRITWPPARRRRLRRLDHAAIYVLIAGTYSPFGMLALSGSSRIAVLAVVWAGALAAIVLVFVWPNRPNWVEAIVAVALGWIGILVLPQLVEAVGVTAVGLVFVGGVFYTVGALVYTRRRPDPVPAVFGYHELFHALVIVAAACQYAAIASLVLAGA